MGGQRSRQAWVGQAALEGALLVLILALAAWLRLSGAAANPGWFSDEGTHLSIANNLLLGRDQYLALGGSVLLASRLPAFEWLLAGALWLAGAGPGGDPARGLAALRALTGALGALTTLLVYAVAREREKERERDTYTLSHLHTALPALLAALVHALYPAAVVYSRFGFSYNLLAPVGLGAFWAAGRYVRGAGRRWLALAAALVGLGTLVDLWAWAWLPALGGAVALRWWHQIPRRAQNARLGMTPPVGAAEAGGADGAQLGMTPQAGAAEAGGADGAQLGMTQQAGAAKAGGAQDARLGMTPQAGAAKAGGAQDARLGMTPQAGAERAGGADDARLGMAPQAGAAEAGGAQDARLGMAPQAGAARWRDLLGDLALALALAGAPFALYAARQLLAVPEAFLFDLRFVLGRLGALDLGQQAAALAENVSTLFAQDGWLMLGLLGLFALRPARRAGLALLFTWLPILLLGRTTALHSLGFYYLIPLLPWAGVGIAAFAAREKEREREKGGRALRLAGWAAAAMVLGGTLWSDARGVREGFATAIDPFLLNAGDAQAAADWLTAQRDPDELALASPALAWLLPGQAADFQMALAYAGQATPHIPPDLPRDRYAYSPHPDRARYVVVDNLTRNWGVVHLPGLGALLAEVETWPLVFQAGEIAVYHRP